MEREIPVINPGILPVKGIIFGGSSLTEFVDRVSFEVGPGGTIMKPITATATETVNNGGYNGEIIIYSSPFWFILPDELISHLRNWNGQGAVICFDIVSAVILNTGPTHI